MRKKKEKREPISRPNLQIENKRKRCTGDRAHKVYLLRFPSIAFLCFKIQSYISFDSSMNFKTLNLEEKKSQIPQSLLFISMNEKKE